MCKLVILDYEIGGVDIIANVPEYDNIEKYEEIVYDHCKYKDSEISWMILDDDALITRYTYDPISEKKIYDNDNLLNG